MGGYGSGRRGGKTCTDDMRFLDVRRWQRDNLLKPGCAFTWNWMRDGKAISSISIKVEHDHLFLAYRRQNGAEWKAECYPVRLEWTPCNFGGNRAWFRCPVAGCGRRVAMLYGGAIFVCRHCHRLAYRCQRESYGDSMARRADKLRRRLKWDEGILNYAGGKPKGMQWGTYQALKERHDYFAGKSLIDLAEHLGMIEGRLSSIGAKLRG